jgi:curved DNA-binding protein CbpA
LKPVQDLYCVLGLTTSATQADIRRAFRDRARQCHPDHSPPDKTVEFCQLTNAYRILRNPETRRIYDTERLRYLAATITVSRHLFVAEPFKSPSPTLATPHNARSWECDDFARS